MLSGVLCAGITSCGAADRLVGWTDLPELAEDGDAAPASAVDLKQFTSAFTTLLEPTNRDVRDVWTCF